jgi:hypothetical protein
MGDHTLLTAREIHGPYMQLLTNLQGDNGHEWLDALKRFNRKENPWLEPKWRMTDRVINFSVTSDGATGEVWIERLETKGFKLSEQAKHLLRSPRFKPTSGVTTVIAVLKGGSFPKSACHVTSINLKGSERGHAKPNPEVVCLIREMFTDKDLEEMGVLGIRVMHSPIKNANGTLCQLDLGREGSGCWVGADSYDPGGLLNNAYAFAFAATQSSSS